MNQNLESQMFQAGASQRMAELLEMEKSAGRAASAFKAITSPSGPVRTAINGAIPSLSSSIGRPLGAMVRKSPLKTLAGGTALLGGTAVGSNMYGQRQGADKVMEGVKSDLAGMQRGFTDFNASQGFGDKLSDMFQYMFNGKDFATNKMNNISQFLSKGNYISDRGSKLLASQFAPAKQVAKIN